MSRSLADLANPNARRFLVVAGEESGDLYAGTIIAELRSRLPDLKVEGIGGGNFRTAGGETLYDIADLASMGLGSALSTLSKLKAAFADLKSRIEAERYDAVILIDFPDFNFRVGQAADEVGLPVFYYVCPQLWAWRSYRVETVREFADMMIVILPFEAAYYESRGIDARFFGHPLLDELPSIDDEEKLALKGDFGAAPGETLIGLLPGSRHGEVERIAPLLFKALKLIRAKKPVRAVVPCPESIDPLLIVDLAEAAGETVTVAPGRAWEVMNSSDFLLCKSGTSTLQAAIAGAPMVIVYKTDLFSYTMARSLVHVKWAGLPNLIAGREIVPEFLQGGATPKNIARAALSYLTDPVKLAAMKEDVGQVRRSLGKPGAAGRAAEAMIEFIERVN